jgi:hypothetical protein
MAVANLEAGAFEFRALFKGSGSVPGSTGQPIQPVSAAARILALDQTAIDAEIVDGFEIVESDQAAERRVSIPPDLATCDDCVREIFDASNRRFRHPFTNCTN